MAPSGNRAQCNSRLVAKTDAPQPDTNRSAAVPAMSVIGRRQLRHQSRNPILHLGEGHGVDDLVGDAIVILAPEMRRAPEIVELSVVQGLGDLLRPAPLRLLHLRHACAGGT